MLSPADQLSPQRHPVVAMLLLVISVGATWLGLDSLWQALRGGGYQELMGLSALPIALFFLVFALDFWKGESGRYARQGVPLGIVALGLSMVGFAVAAIINGAARQEWAGAAIPGLGLVWLGIRFWQRAHTASLHSSDA